MSDNQWLDLRRGAPGLQSHFLFERKEAYDGVENARQMVMLVRGEAPASFAGGFHRSKQVHLIPLGSIVLAECALHLQDFVPKVKAGPQPGSTQLHPINANALASPTELAHRLYALSLAPLCTTIIFAEGEFETVDESAGLDAIVQLLISWARIILACGSSPRYRPHIVIFRRRPALLPRDLESRMTGQVLATCNATRDLTTKKAESIWKQCFSGIAAVPAGLEDELGICEQAIATSSAVGQACPAMPSHSLPTLLHTACTQFPFNYKPFNVLLASRLFPVSGDLPRQLEVLFRHASAFPNSITPASRLAASALVKDVFFAKLLAFRPVDCFEELYQPCLDRLKRHVRGEKFVAAVYSNFLALAADMQNGKRLPRATLMEAVHAWDSIIEKQSIDAWYQTLCFSCLGCRPHNKLSCGHYICDPCIHRDGMDNCAACGLRNYGELYAKPPTAGVRVLSLSGDATDAPSIAQLLQQLRFRLHSPLHKSFDLVFAQGIGIFFTLMIFCKKAPIEDCVYHLPNIEYVKETRHSFKFGRLLKFRREEFQSNLARVIILFGSEGSPKAEAQRFWPGCKTDIVLQYHGNQSKQTPINLIADKLIASLFYIEPGLAPSLWTQASVSIALTVKCRLQPGPELANLILRLRLEKAKIEFHGHGEVRQIELCPAFVWDRIRFGRSFERTLCLLVASDSTYITCSIKTNKGSASFEDRRLSNCPIKVCDLVAAHPTCRVTSRESHVLIKKIDEMENRLRALKI